MDIDQRIFNLLESYTPEEINQMTAEAQSRNTQKIKYQEKIAAANKILEGLAAYGAAIGDKELIEEIQKCKEEDIVEILEGCREAIEFYLGR